MLEINKGKQNTLFSLASILCINRTGSLSSSCRQHFLFLVMRNFRRYNWSATRSQPRTDRGCYSSQPWEGEVPGKGQFCLVRQQQFPIPLFWLYLLAFFIQKIFFCSLESYFWIHEATPQVLPPLTLLNRVEISTILASSLHSEVFNEGCYQKQHFFF